MNKLLIVEDDVVTLFIYEEWFDGDDNVVLCESVADAIEALQNHKISHILSDFNLDDLTAGDLFKQIPDVEKYHLALALGSDVTPAQQKVLDSFSIEQHFKKPIDKEEIMNWMEA